MSDHPATSVQGDLAGQAAVHRIDEDHPGPVPLDQDARQLDEQCVQDATRLAEHDADSAEHQAERASKNTTALVGALPILATAVSLIAGFLSGRPIHLFAGVGVALGAALFEVTFGLAMWNMGSDLPVDPQPHHSSWLGIYSHDRDSAEHIRAHYRALARDPIVAYGREAIDVGHVAHRKHRRVRLLRWLTLGLLVEVTLTFLLWWAGR